MLNTRLVMCVTAVAWLRGSALVGCALSDHRETPTDTADVLIAFRRRYAAAGRSRDKLNKVVRSCEAANVEVNVNRTPKIAAGPSGM